MWQLWQTAMMMAPDGGDGGGGDGGDGGDGGGAPEWHANSEYISSNPDAAKAYSKYDSLDAALQGGHEAMKMVGQPYRLPKDYSSLSEDQQAEIRASVAEMDGGLPASAEEYEFALPEGTELHEGAMQKFREWCHENRVPIGQAQRMLDLEIALAADRVADREQTLNNMTEEHWKEFVKSDCKGNEALAKQELDNVRKFMQTQFKKDDGSPDSEAYEAWKERFEYNDRPIELATLRALREAARVNVAEGGAPPGNPKEATIQGGLTYAEMQRK